MISAVCWIERSVEIPLKKVIKWTKHTERNIGSYLSDGDVVVSTKEDLGEFFFIVLVHTYKYEL